MLLTTVVGSYPQPDWLLDRAALGARLPPRVRAREIWRVDPRLLEQAQDDATVLALRDMETAGIDIVTDGEIRRESYSNPFATALEGMDLENPGTALDRTGHPNPVPRVSGPIRRPRPVLERDVLSARVHDYAPRLLDELMAAGEVMWVGAGPLGRDDGKVALYLRDQTPLLLGPSSGDAPVGDEHDRLRELLARRGACFFRELGGRDDKETLDALWDLVWAGELTNDSFAAVRAGPGNGPSHRRPSTNRARPRLGSLTALGPPRAQGRWSLVDRDGEGLSSTEAAHALAGTLLDRHGVLTREAVRGEGIGGGFAGVYPVLKAMEEAGRIRRGYFVTGLGGAQFALPGAVDRLRSVRDGSPDGRPKVIVLAATDPANAYGLSLPWPDALAGRPVRVAGAYVVLVDGLASLYVERSGKGLVPLRDFDGSWEEPAIGALEGLLGNGRFKRLAIERFPDELRSYLEAASFVPSPKGLVRYA